jgi:hypothetical protein
MIDSLQERSAPTTGSSCESETTLHALQIRPRRGRARLPLATDGAWPVSLAGNGRPPVGLVGWPVHTSRPVHIYSGTAAGVGACTRARASLARAARRGHAMQRAAHFLLPRPAPPGRRRKCTGRRSRRAATDPSYLPSGLCRACLTCFCLHLGRFSGAQIAAGVPS